MRTTTRKSATGKQITMMLDQDMLSKIEQFMEQEEIVSPAEAMRTLARIALSSDVSAAIKDARTRRAYREQVSWAREQFAAWCTQMRETMLEANRIAEQSGLTGTQIEGQPEYVQDPASNRGLGDQNEDQLGYPQDPNFQP